MDKHDRYTSLTLRAREIINKVRYKKFADISIHIPTSILLHTTRYRTRGFLAPITFGITSRACECGRGIVINRVDLSGSLSFTPPAIQAK